MNAKKQILLVSAMFFLLFTTYSMADTAIVTTETLKLRKEPSTSATILELLNEDEKLEIIEQSGDWLKVKYKQITGYVHKDYVKIQKDQNSNVQTVNTEKPNENTVQNTIENTITNTENPSNSEITQNTETGTTTTENPQTEQTTQENKSYLGENTIQITTKVYILPLINSSKIGNVEKNTKVNVLEQVNAWLYVQTENIAGWVPKYVIQEKTNNDNSNNNNNNADDNKTTQQPSNDNTSKETPIEEKTMYVNYSSIYVRKGPSTKEDVVETLILNDEVTVTAEIEDWYKVKVNGKEGYIAKRLLSKTETKVTSRSSEEREEEKQEVSNAENTKEISSISLGEEIVNYAKQYLGCKYIYGGVGPTAFDCSGFTMYVYKNFGISLSHSARAQSNNGTFVEKDNLQLGDLVFFKDYETMNGIGHCGIYIGDGSFIHASSGTGYCVKISTLLTGAYYNRYETARRLI